jgi:hypothetical protein
MAREARIGIRRIVMSNCLKLLNGTIRNTGNTRHFHTKVPCRFPFHPRKTQHRGNILITVHLTQAQQVAE